MEENGNNHAKMQLFSFGRKEASDEVFTKREASDQVRLRTERVK